MDIFKKNSTATETGEEVHARLTELAKLGHPRLCQIDGGWYCTVEINVKSAGTRFEVTSGFGHTSPIAALSECVQRVQNVQRSLELTA
jgi:hypothetical protein